MILLLFQDPQETYNVYQMFYTRGAENGEMAHKSKSPEIKCCAFWPKTCPIVVRSLLSDGSDSY